MTESIESTEGKQENWQEKKIREAQSFEELYVALREIDEIKGSDGRIYQAEELIDAIHNLRKNEGLASKYVTRTFGLRDKVEELLGRE